MNEIIQSLKELTENLSIQKDDKERILENLAVLKSDTYCRMCEDFTTEDIISFLKSLSILQNKVKIILSSKAVAKIRDNYSDLKNYYGYLADYYTNKKDFAGSIPHYKEIVRLTEEQYGENDEIVADELEPLADAYKNLGDKKNAAVVAERIRSIHSK